MIKLTAGKRDEAKALLEDHQKVCDALKQVDKATWVTSIFLTHADGTEDLSVECRHTVAKAALVEQKGWIEAELENLGDQVGPTLALTSHYGARHALASRLLVVDQVPFPVSTSDRRTQVRAVLHQRWTMRMQQ